MLLSLPYCSPRRLFKHSSVAHFPNRRLQHGSLKKSLPLLRHSLHTATSQQQTAVPFRKQLKDDAKLRRARERQQPAKFTGDEVRTLDKWKLTVGIEIHAQLNTERKLFSYASSQLSEEPNTRTTFFDLALPGSQPIFQKAALLPALRAALALKCRIQRTSQFDRKHYFYQDQPAGYQITQYYEPFARDGSLTLYDHDGIAPEDGRSIEIGIKQIQMEQDTAKSTLQPPDTSLLDFNRVGHPLIEIITLPYIHHPQTAAACVRKIQSILQSINAVTTGMEMGGLRADVNVSITLRGSTSSGNHSYSGVTGLGQRTEIKNLSSFKAVEDAIVAERNRQIGVLEAGGSIDGETRGWALGSTETTRLRGKEGEVDYRYMPDPDITPVVISEGLIERLTATLPATPDDSIAELIRSYSVSPKAAKILVTADDGLRLDFFHEVARRLHDTHTRGHNFYTTLNQTLANWTIHEIGALLTRSETPFSDWPVSPENFAALITNLVEGHITGTSAKSLLSKMFDRDPRSVEQIIKEEGLTFEQLPQDYYEQAAANLVATHSDVVKKIQSGQVGKLQWLVGQMVRSGKGKVDAKRAEEALKACVEKCL